MKRCRSAAGPRLLASHPENDTIIADNREPGRPFARELPMPQQAAPLPNSAPVPSRSLKLWQRRPWHARQCGEAIRSRMAEAIAAEEQAGLRFAFAARAVAVLIVALWVLFVVPSP